MAVSFGKNNSFERRFYKVPANSLYTIDFTSNKPNFYRLNNMSNMTLFCATNSMPSVNLYDFKASPNSVANFTEPNVKDKLYILNNSMSEANIILSTWADDFDATFMAVSEITLNNDAPLQTDGIIKNFQCSLPQGNNTIGKVLIDDESLKHMKSDDILSWLQNNLYSNSGHGILENFSEYLYKIMNSTEKMGNGDDSLKGIGELKSYSVLVSGSENSYCYINKPGEFITSVECDSSTMEYTVEGQTFYSIEEINHYLKTNNVETIEIYHADEPSSKAEVTWYTATGTTSLFDLLKSVFSATGEVKEFTTEEGRKTVFDLLYWIFEQSIFINNALTGTSSMVGADYTIYELLNIIRNKLESIGSKSATRITDGKYFGYVMDENWVSCNEDTEYIGEILNMSDKVEITTIRTKLTGEEDLESFTMAEWNKVCHIIKAHTVNYISTTGSTSNRPFPYFAVYNY